MSIRFGLIVGLLVAILVTYLTSINPARVHVAFGGDWAVDVPLMALVAIVFVQRVVISGLMTMILGMGN